MGAIRKTVAAPFRVIFVVGVVIWILSGLWSLGWYVGWLDDNFLPWILAAPLGFITCTFFPFAVLIEWIWHGWPGELTKLLSFWALGLILMGVSRIVGNALAGESHQL